MTAISNSPDPATRYPLPGNNEVIFLKSFITAPYIEVGDYSYYHAAENPEAFERTNVRYGHEGMKEKLIIGRFCAVAEGATFIMGPANHRMDGPSTFPFPILGEGWADHMGLLMDLPSRGDTSVGHDVWFGYQSLVMPGVKIGHGAIVATRAVVTRDVPPYAIVAGNPARVVRFRFDESTIARLLEIAWWDRPIDWISAHIPALMAGEVADLA